MLSLLIEDGNLVIKDLEKKQLHTVIEWFCSNEDSYKYAMGIDKPLTYDELYEKYLEVLINTHEFFLGINVDNEFVGYIKGRADYKNEGEIWIMSMLIGLAYQNKGIGTKSLKLIMNELKERFGITKYYACLIKDNFKGKSFWNSNGFLELRQSKGYFTIDNKSYDLVIMYRQL